MDSLVCLHSSVAADALDDHFQGSDSSICGLDLPAGGGAHSQDDIGANALEAFACDAWLHPAGEQHLPLPFKERRTGPPGCRDAWIAETFRRVGTMQVSRACCDGIDHPGHAIPACVGACSLLGAKMALLRSPVATWATNPEEVERELFYYGAKAIAGNY